VLRMGDESRPHATSPIPWTGTGRPLSVLTVRVAISATPTFERVIESMERIGILAILRAKPERAGDVEAFLKSAQSLAQSESQTLRWYAFKLDDSRFGIFDTFADDDGRQAHVAGEIARQLFAAAVELLAAPPSIEFAEIIGNKDWASWRPE